ncbi:MAG: hypothetical protein ABIS92_16500 [Polyangia bacterium]
MSTTGAAARAISAVAALDEAECWPRWRSSDDADEPDEAADEAAVAAGNRDSQDVSEEESEKTDLALAEGPPASAPGSNADGDGPAREAPVAV